MRHNLSACVFIKDNFKGAFCLYESVASLLPFVDEFVVMDLGSTDGTLEILREITQANTKFKLIIKNKWPEIDAGVFADLANELVNFCANDKVLYFQADEIWHQDLLKLMQTEFDQGNFDLAFWRIQYRNNFQYTKWLPHIVHRVGYKDNFNFVGDGMNTNRTYDAKICSQYGGEYFPKWGEFHAKSGDDAIKPYVNEMIMDVSQVGGFRDNIIDRRLLHIPLWHETSPILPEWDSNGKEYKVEAHVWARNAKDNPDWTKALSPFDLPQIMRYHIGKTRYELRSELLEAIKRDNTRELIGLL
jgi:glycosyltransferase involved in cell wall biosynthesis